MNISLEDTSKPDLESFETYEESFKLKLSELYTDYQTGNYEALYAALLACQEDALLNLRHTESDEDWARIPMWLFKPLMDSVAARVKSAKVALRGKNSKYYEQRKQDRVDYHRYETVLDMFEKKKLALKVLETCGDFPEDAGLMKLLKYKDVTWDNVFDFAADFINQRYQAALSLGLINDGFQCCAKTVEKSYSKVKSAQAQSPRRYKFYNHISF